MPSDSGEQRPVKLQMPVPESESIPCPRCDSNNTKFCYYNNYNLSQPRHFCKSCRRYWTQGGTLRNIPVGGGTRKNAKRSRTCSSSSLSSQENITNNNPISANNVISVISTPTTTLETRNDTIGTLPLRCHDLLDLNNVNVSGGSFTSLLSTQCSSSQGFSALGGFGLGLSSGFEDMGFELGRGIWPLEEVAVETSGGTGGGGGDSVDTWHIGNGGDHHHHHHQHNNGFVDGDCFAWPELAISTTNVRRDQKA